MSPAKDPRRGGQIVDWFGTATTLAGGIAALAGFVYLVGGMVMWLRFRTADLPADQGVALMSREQLFVVGLRLMIIPTLVTGTIAALLALRVAPAGAKRRGALGWAGLAALALLIALVPVWSFAVAGWPAELAVLLDALIVAGGACVAVGVHMRAGAEGRLAALPRWLAPTTAGAAAALVLVLCLAVPALEVDDELWVRAAVAVGALLLMAVPALVFLARRLASPPARAWSAIPVLAVGFGVVVAPSWGARVAIVLGALVIAGAAAAAIIVLGERAPSPELVRRWALPVLAIALVGLILPWSFASATWPLGFAIVVAVWLWRRPRLAADSDPTEAAVARRRLAVVMAAAAVVAAAVVSIGRQLDEPVQLLRATVTYKDTAATLEGAYVNASGDTVYIGNQDTGTIQAIPRGEVRQVSVGPPEERAPSPSLLSRILPGDERFSARPLEVWCDGERYAWTEADKVCETQPKLAWTTPLHERFLDRLGMPVRVRCPPEARDVCRGWVLLTSSSDFVHGRIGIPRPVVHDPVPFAVGPRRITEVCATLTAGQLRLLRGEYGERVVPFEAVLAQDPEGETVLAREYYGLLVGPERLRDAAPDYSDCRPRLGLAHSLRDDGVTVTVTARPHARGITPWHVEGSIRLTATRSEDVAEEADGAAPDRKPVPLGSEELADGRARFAVDLPPGPWVITARYASVTGLPYDEPSPELAVVVPVKRSR